MFGASIALTSHHLRALWKAGLIELRKEGKLVFYSLSPGAMNGQLHAIVRRLVEQQTRPEATADRTPASTPER